MTLRGGSKVAYDATGGVQVIPSSPPRDEGFNDRTHLSLRRNLTCDFAISQLAILADPIRGADSLRLGTPRAWTLRAIRIGAKKSLSRAPRRLAHHAFYPQHDPHELVRLALGVWRGGHVVQAEAERHVRVQVQRAAKGVQLGDELVALSVPHPRVLQHVRVGQEVVHLPPPADGQSLKEERVQHLMTRQTSP
eukprot:123505-Prorocentrum_minimum.AAC.8